MGCDIHLYKEVKINGVWQSPEEWVIEYEDQEVPDVKWENRFTDRNYELFGMLSDGVRSSFDFSFAPRGMPMNLCEQIVAKRDYYGDDGHSDSYLYIHELKEAADFIKTATITISGMKDAKELEVFRAEIARGVNVNWELLYPYCEWASMSSYKEFEIDVPANFIIGNSLQKIIDSFDGIEGENHRIVFWFDN